jgi:hypothetical protein
MDKLILSTLLKYMIVRDILPKDKPLKHIKTFEDFCNTCIFPFLVFESGEDNESCAYDDSEMGSVEESAGMSITGN